MIRIALIYAIMDKSDLIELPHIEAGLAVWDYCERSAKHKFYTLADDIDRNAGLSRDGKYRQRSRSANEAIADFEASKTLTRAREAVKLAVAKNDSPDGVGMLKAMKETEAGWQKAIDKIAERAGLSKIPSIPR